MSGAPHLWQFKAMTSAGWVAIVILGQKEAYRARRRFVKEGQACGKVEYRGKP